MQMGERGVCRQRPMLQPELCAEEPWHQPPVQSQLHRAGVSVRVPLRGPTTVRRPPEVLRLLLGDLLAQPTLL